MSLPLWEMLFCSLCGHLLLCVLLYELTCLIYAHLCWFLLYVVATFLFELPLHLVVVDGAMMFLLTGACPLLALAVCICSFFGCVMMCSDCIVWSLSVDLYAPLFGVLCALCDDVCIAHGLFVYLFAIVVVIVFTVSWLCLASLLALCIYFDILFWSVLLLLALAVMFFCECCTLTIFSVCVVQFEKVGVFCVLK